MTSGEDPRLTRLSEICLAHPGATHQDLGEHAAFMVRGKKFAYFLANHHPDGRIAITCRALPGEQEAVLTAGAERFFRPDYLGHRGWIGIRLDLAPTDWQEVADAIMESYEMARQPGGSRKS